MLIDPNNPANHPILETLRDRARSARPLTPPAEVVDPYYETGSHPEIVAWMWEKLSKKFPDESRCLVYGMPCVIQPVSGVILAVGMGTQYCLRVLDESLEEAASFRCTPIHRWAGGEKVTDLSDMYGKGWVFGSFGKESIKWFRATYHHFNIPPASDSNLIVPSTPAVGDQRERMSLLVGQEPNFNLRVHSVEPDPATVDSVVRAVHWSGFATVMMWKAEQEFLEISGSLRAEDGLSATYMEGETEKVSRTAPSLDEAISLLQSYAAGDSRYKSLIDWE